MAVHSSRRLAPTDGVASSNVAFSYLWLRLGLALTQTQGNRDAAMPISSKNLSPTGLRAKKLYRSLGAAEGRGSCFSIGGFMSTNSFRPKKYEDHQIVDPNGLVVGHIRVKPSGVLWSPKNAKVWYRVTLDKFAAFAEEKGTRTKK